MFKYINYSKCLTYLYIIFSRVAYTQIRYFPVLPTPKMTSMRDEKLMDFAIEQAKMSSCRNRHGCVAVVSGKIVGRGYNRVDRMDPCDRERFSCHAEMDALRGVSMQLKVAQEDYAVRCASFGQWTSG